MAVVSLRGGRGRQATGHAQTDHDEVNAYIAHMRGVRTAVAAEGRKIQARAEALFAEHDRPGGHRIVGEKGLTDYTVSLEGPVPIVIEFGREGFTRPDGRYVGPMEGLHILGRAIGL